MLLELAPGGHLYKLLCDKPQAGCSQFFSGRVGGSVSFAPSAVLPHPKTSESPAEGAVLLEGRSHMPEEIIWLTGFLARGVPRGTRQYLCVPQ